MPRLLAIFTFFALLAVPASAAEPAPTPGCQGVNITDKAGDSANSLQTSQTGSPSSDLIAGFITYDPAKHTAKANIQVDNLTLGEVDPPFVGVGWEMGFTTPVGPRYVRGYMDRSGMARYNWGEPRAVTDDQTTPRAGGPTTGALFPGKNGIISVDIPLADMGIKAGGEFKALSMEVRQWASTPAAVPSTPTAIPLYSPAPIFDEASGKGTFKLGPCPAPVAGPVTAVLAPVAAAPAATDAAALRVTAKVPALNAKKVNRSRKVVVALTGEGTNLVAQLRKGGATGPVVASGKLAKLAGKGKVTLKVTRKLKKGKHTFVLSGGAPTAKTVVAVKVR